MAKRKPYSDVLGAYFERQEFSGRYLYNTYLLEEHFPKGVGPLKLNNAVSAGFLNRETTASGLIYYELTSKGVELAFRYKYNL